MSSEIISSAIEPFYLSYWNFFGSVRVLFSFICHHIIIIGKWYYLHYPLVLYMKMTIFLHLIIWKGKNTWSVTYWSWQAFNISNCNVFKYFQTDRKENLDTIKRARNNGLDRKNLRIQKKAIKLKPKFSFFDNAERKNILLKL